MKKYLWNVLYRFFPNHGHHLIPNASLYDWQKNRALAQGIVRLDGPEAQDPRLQLSDQGSRASE